MGTSLIMLITSVDSQATAELLAHDLVKQRLAACAHVSSSVASVYSWKGNMESTEEYCLSIKTTMEKLDDTLVWLDHHHPYEVPELLWWPVQAGDAYARWVHEEV